MNMKTYNGVITTLKDNQFFVFGSNFEGRHGKGSALYARTHFGAIYGQAKGLQGQSYAIITKDLTKRIQPSVTEDFIIEQIKELYDLANLNKDKEYLIAYNGLGKNLNGYSAQQMANMFSFYEIPENIIFEENFQKLIKNKKK